MVGPRFSNFHIFMGRANFVSWPIVSDGDAAAAWIWPSLGSFKLTTDASLMNGRPSGGGLVRGHEGRLIFAF